MVFSITPRASSNDIIAEQDFTVDLQFTNSDNDTLLGLGVNLFYNSQELDFVDNQVTFPGSTADVFIVADNNNEDGNDETNTKASLLFTSTTGLNLVGANLATLPFRTTANFDGTQIILGDPIPSPSTVDATASNLTIGPVDLRITPTVSSENIIPEQDFTVDLGFSNPNNRTLLGLGVNLFYNSQELDFADDQVTFPGATADIFIVADTNNEDGNAETDTKASLLFTSATGLNLVGESLATLPFSTTAAFDGTQIILGSPNPSPSNVTASADNLIIDRGVESTPVNLSIDPTSGSEAETTTFTITATADSAVSGEQTIDLALSGTATGDDFDGDVPTTITIADGETTGTITVTVTNDTVIEGEETATFTISNPSAGLTLGGTTEVSATIADNDDLLSLLDDPLIRFRNENVQGTYLFAGEEEARGIRENFIPPFVQEGFAFNVSFEANDDLVRFTRFQSTFLAGTYIFADDTESQSIRDNFSDAFREEGTAFYALGADANLGQDVIRFRNLNNNTYLFALGEEAQSIEQNFSDTFVREGVAFEVPVI